MVKDRVIRATFKSQQIIVRSSAGVGGKISYNGDTLIGYGSSIYYTITPDVENEIDSIILDGVKQPNSLIFSINNIRASHTLRVSFKRLRFVITGNVFGNQGRISTLRDTQYYGASLRVTYQANAGYNLAYILIDNNVNYDSLVGYTFTNITQNHTITPIFTFITIPNSPTNITALGGNSQALVSFTAPVNSGGSPIIRYNISTTTGNITASGVGSPIVVTGLTNGTSYRFVVTAVNAIGSSLSSDTSNAVIPRSSGKYVNTMVVGGQITPTSYVDSGYNFVVRYSNKTGYVLDSIYINGTYSAIATADSLSQYTFKNITADSTIKVVYKITTYTITVNAGNGGTISPQGVSNVNYGATPNYTITPNTGYFIDSIIVNGNKVTNVNNYTFDTIKSNQTIRAVFKLQTYTITAIAGNGGSISPQGISTLNYGDTPRFTITPNTGYFIDSIIVNGNKVANVNNYIFDSVKSNQTIRVVFKLQTYTITSIAGNGGSISPQGVSNVNYGAMPIYTITPNTGYLIDSVFVNGNKVTNVNNYTFDSVKSNQTIRVVFKLQIFTITANAGNGGSISSQGAISLNYGATPTYTITPNTGYQIDSIIINGNKVTNVNNYTFDTIKADQTIRVTFKLIQYIITGFVNASQGSISTTRDTVNYGSNLRVTYQAKTGYNFSNIIVDGVTFIYDSLNGYTFTNITQNHSITAIFTSITIPNPPTNIVAVGGDAQATISFTAPVNNGGSPIIRYNISTTTGNITASGVGSPIVLTGLTNGTSYRFVVTAVNAIGSSQSFDTSNAVIPRSSGKYVNTMVVGGQITPTSYVDSGYNFVVRYSNKTGYVLDSIFINGAYSAIATADSISQYTFKNITADSGIKVVYKITTYTITANAGNGGTISPQGVSNVNYGATPNYTITPNTGYLIDSIFVNNNWINNANNIYTFDTIKSNQTIRAVFKLQTYTISAIAGNGGSISPQGISTINYGDTSRYSITPNTGYIIDSVLVNNLLVNIVNNNYTFDSVKSNQTIRVVFKLQTFTITSIAGNGGSISPQGVSNVNYGATPIYNITPNTGYLIDSVFVNNTWINNANNTYTFDSVKANQTIRVVFKLQSYTITANAGNGGSISSQGAINVNYGATPTYTITPNTGYLIDSIFVNNIRVNNNNNYTFDTIKADQTIRVTFKLIQYIITGFVNASQGSISTIRDTVNYGSNLRVTYQAKAGYNLSNIIVDGDFIYDSLVGYTFTNIMQNHSITVIFNNNVTAPNPPTNIIAVGGNAQATVSFAAPVNNGGSPIIRYNISTTTGNITASGVGSPIVVTGLTNGTSYRFVVTAVNAIGSSQSFDTSNAVIPRSSGKYVNTIVFGGQITPTSYVDSGYNFVVRYSNKTGYVLDSIFINGAYSAIATADSISQYTFKNITADSGIKVVYKITTYTITANAGNGGSISPQGIYNVNYGATPNYTIIPNTGYLIDSIFVNNNWINNANNIYTFDTIKSNQTIRAVFKLQTYTISAIAGNGGSISLQGISTINYGAIPSYTITPNTGYLIDSIIVNGNKVQNVNNYIFDSVKANQTIRVIFKLQTFTITSIAGNGGSISPQGVSNVNYGATPIYNITPNTGYLIDSVFVNNIWINNANNTYTFDSVKANQTIRVVFKLQSYTITANAGNGGSISSQGAINVNYGATPNYTITPNTGYQIDSLIINGNKVTNVNNYTFDTIKANQNIRVTFKLIQYIITGFVNASQGSISTIRDTVNYGSNLRVTYQAKAGNNLAYILINNNIVIYDSLEGYTFTNITQNYTITPIFTFITIPNPATNIIAVGGNAQASISFVAPVNNGGSPIIRYNISTTTGNITASGVGSPIVVTGLINGTSYRFVVTAVNAIGSSQSFDTSNAVIPRSSGKYVNTMVVGGQITPTSYVDSGYNFVVRYSNKTGYVLDSIYINGEYSARATADSISQYTFKNVQADSGIKVVYKITTYTITSSAGNGGTISPQGVSNVNYGATPNYTITPNTGYLIDSIFVNNNWVNNANNIYTFDTIKSNQTIRAVFKLQAYTISAIAGNGGSISPQGISTINYGDTPRYSITPNTGYIIDSVLVNNLLVNIVNNNYTFDSVKSNQTIRVIFKLQTFTITSIAGNGGSISPQGVSNVNYGATPIYNITPNTGYLIDSVFVNNIWINNVNNTYTFDSVKANQTIRVVFKLQIFTITANAGNGGSISSQGAINVNYGATPIYTITPNTGYLIDSLIINGNKVTNVNNYTFDTIKANQTIRVTFKLIQYIITGFVNASQGSISTIRDTVNYGSNLRVTYQANSGFNLSNIIVDGDFIYDSLFGYTFTNIMQNHSITVIFNNNVTAPNPPTNIIAVGGNTQATISFTAPVNNGGSPITRYNISTTTGNITASGVSSPIVVTGLTNGTSYRFVVTAVNAIGSSQSIDTSNAVIPRSSGKYVNTMVVGGQITPTSYVDSGYNFVVRYSNKAGYVLDSIYINGEYSAITTADSISQYTFKNITADSTIKVVYKITTYTIIANAGNGGTISPQGVSNVNYGATPNYTITPNTGYLIDSIFVNNNWVNNANNIYTFDTIKSNQNIRAVFKLQTYTISAIAGNGGSISPQGISNVNYGAIPSYTITPNTGYQIDSIIVNGNKVANVNNYIFDSVKANQTIRVVFKLQSYTISAIAGNGGSISPQGVSNVNYGAMPIYTITPNTGYLIDSVFVNNIWINNANNTYTFDSVKANQTIRVVFKLQSYIITADAGNGGSISPQGAINVNYGATPTYTITPNTGYLIDSIFVNNIRVNNNNNYTFDTIKANQTIRVTFKLIQYIITGFVNASQGIISTTRDTVNYGSNLRVTYQAKTGYNFSNIIVDGEFIYDSIVGYTFTNITQNHIITPIFNFITVPNKPTNITALGGNTQSTVSFEAPVNNGGSPITRYNISTTEGNITASGVGSPIVVTGLTNGTPYRFVVTAVNAIGSSLSSDTSNAVIPRASAKYVNTMVVSGQITPTSYIDSGANFVVRYSNKTGYVLDSIYINGEYSAIATADSISQYTFKNITADSTIKVVYKITTYTITSSAGNGGSISPQGVSNVNYGATPRYIIIPNTGYLFDSIFVNNNWINNANNIYTFDTIKSNQTIRVVFKLQNFSIIAIAGNGGSISPQGISTINYGTTPSYTITPNTGYIIDSIIVNGNKVANVNNYIFDSVKSNQTIRVLFKLQTYTITAIAGNGGSISPQGVSNVNYGAMPIYTITPNTGYLIDSIFVNNIWINNVNNTYTFDSVKANQTLRVLFKIQTFIISAIAGNGGSINYAGDSILNYGANIVYSITPNTGYLLDSLIIDGAVQPNTNNYTFRNITANHRIRVSFKLIQYIITGVVNASQGRISTIRDTVNYGNSLRVTYQANSSFKVSYIIVDGTFIYDSLIGYTFNNITQNHNLIVIFANNITAPTPPTNIVAVGGNAQATVSFTEPVSNGGSPINKYNISSTTGNITASGISSPIVVTGLTNGTSYRFVVNAINAIGSSLSSDTSNAIKSIVNGKYVNTVVVGGQITNTTYLELGANFGVTYTNKAGYVLDSIYINGVYSARITADSLTRYTFKNITADSAIKIVYKITNYTITAIAGNGGSISPIGVSRVNYGTTPNYAITPNTGYLIDSITVNGNKVPNVNNYTFDSVKSNQTIKVVFKLQTFTITTSAGNEGRISPQGVSNVNYGATPSYTITPNIGYEIDSIIINGNKVSNVNYLTIDSVKANQIIRIVFKPQTFTIFASARSGGIISPQGNTLVKFGDRQVYTISPNNGYIIDSIVVNGVKITNSNIVTLDTIKSNLTLIVTFKLKSFTITSKAGLNGKIISEGVVNVNIGASRIYSIVPDEGYDVDSLIINDIVLFNTNVYIFNDVQSNHTIRATFKIKRFNIVSSAGIGGTISPLDSLFVSYGAKQIYIITPNAGYIIDSLIIDGNKIDNSNTYTFGNISENHTIRVTFKLKPIIKECPSTKVTPTIVRVGTALQSDITNFSKHKWYLDGIFKDSTKLNSYTPSTSGVYTLLGLDTNECESNFSKKYYYSNTCIIPTGRISNAVSIQGKIIDYPNQIIFKWCPDIIQQNLNIKVIDMTTGALIMNLFIPSNLNTFILDKQKINSNNYLIQVLDSNGELLETSDYNF